MIIILSQKSDNGFLFYLDELSKSKFPDGPKFIQKEVFNLKEPNQIQPLALLLTNSELVKLESIMIKDFESGIQIGYFEVL